MYDGYRIIESHLMVDTIEDWSRVRSPSRAARRRRRGYRQNIVIRQIPRRDVLVVGLTLIMHPEVAASVRAEIRETDEVFDRHGERYRAQDAQR